MKPQRSYISAVVSSQTFTVHLPQWRAVICFQTLRKCERRSERGVTPPESRQCFNDELAETLFIQVRGPNIGAEGKSAPNRCPHTVPKKTKHTRTHACTQRPEWVTQQPAAMNCGQTDGRRRVWPTALSACPTVILPLICIWISYRLLSLKGSFCFVLSFIVYCNWDFNMEI